MISSCHSNTKAAAAYQGPAFLSSESPCVAQSEPRTHKLLSGRFCMQVHVRCICSSEHAAQYRTPRLIFLTSNITNLHMRPLI
jgi:hypothetical protein